MVYYATFTYTYFFYDSLRIAKLSYLYGFVTILPIYDQYKDRHEVLRANWDLFPVISMYIRTNLKIRYELSRVTPSK